jgi:hypothetical protein
VRRDHADEDEDLIATGYGYGMFTGTFAGHAAYYHPGDNPGYLSFAGWIPDARPASSSWPTTRAWKWWTSSGGYCRPRSNRSAGGLVAGRHEDEEE